MINYAFLVLSLFLFRPAMAAVGISVEAICVEKEESHFKEFLPTAFDQNRTTIGQDQAEVIAEKIRTFISSNPEIKISKIQVNSTSARVPFYITRGQRKVIDPNSDARNSNLARDRAQFAQTVLLGLKSTTPALKESALSIESGLGGPEFKPTDLNDRFVTPMTQNYKARVESFFKRNEELYKGMALKNSNDLLDEEKFPNLYQVKFKPFEGFRLEIFGKKKCKSSTETDSPHVIPR